MLEATLAANQPQSGLFYTSALESHARFREESNQYMAVYVIASVVGSILVIAFWYFVFRWLWRLSKRHRPVIMMGYIDPMGSMVPMGTTGTIGQVGHTAKGIMKAS